MSTFFALKNKWAQGHLRVDLEWIERESGSGRVEWKGGRRQSK